jgi:glucose-6-phosphate dehydrogenase assembly protein OpcA
MATATTDVVWSAQDTTPAAVEAALRQMLAEAHAENASYVPARVLNLVCVVDDQWSGEVANRLRGVGRYHASRTVMCSVHARRRTIDAVATIAAPAETRPGEFALTRETIVVDIGEQHVAHLDTVVDPLVVTDLATLVWAPHGHADAIDALTTGHAGGAGLAQIVLLDSVDEPDPGEALRRARELSERVYVVDLAWLRSTPWRERLAAAFDPGKVRPDLELISSITVRHHPDSAAAALLLVGWLASRLGWDAPALIARGGALEGRAHGRRQDAAIRLEPDATMQVRGLAGVEVQSASGRSLRYDRGPGGLRAHYHHRRGTDREGTVMGASRGEAGILGEGIRQALLRDPTYRPALACAVALAG